MSLKKITTALRPLPEQVDDTDGHKFVIPRDIQPEAVELVRNVEGYMRAGDAKVKQLRYKSEPLRK